MIFNNKLIENNKIMLQRSRSKYINNIMLKATCDRISNKYTYFIIRTNTHYIIKLELKNQIEEA